MRIIAALISGLADVSGARFKVEKEKRNDVDILIPSHDYLRLTLRGWQKISARSRVRLCNRRAHRERSAPERMTIIDEFLSIGTSGIHIERRIYPHLMNAVPSVC